MRNNPGSSRLFRASEAAALGLHAAAVLAGVEDRLAPTREIAAALKVSEAHLAKVMVQLERSGIVTGVRGPTGGYRLARPARHITLKEVYEAIEGPLQAGDCPFGVPVCDGTRCVLGGFFDRLNRQAVDKLHRTRVSDIVLTLGGNHAQA